jgi:hypothetical protein
LVTDLPADFEVFGQAVATSMADLLGGTTGQVLAKNSNTDMDFVWVTSDDANAIQNTIVDAKGDLIGATAADTPARLAVGTNGQVLTADSTAATGLKWATPAAGGYTQIASQALTGSAINFNSIPGTYNKLVLVLDDFYLSSNIVMLWRVNADSTANRYTISGTTNSPDRVIYDTYTAWWVDYSNNLTTTSKKNMAVMEMENYSNTTSFKVLNSRSYYEGQSGFQYAEQMVLGYKSTSAITAINLLPFSGNFSGGTATLWGVK